MWEPTTNAFSLLIGFLRHRITLAGAARGAKRSPAMPFALLLAIGEKVAVDGLAPSLEAAKAVPLLPTIAVLPAAAAAPPPPPPPAVSQKSDWMRGGLGETVGKGVRASLLNAVMLLVARTANSLLGFGARVVGLMTVLHLAACIILKPHALVSVLSPFDHLNVDDWCSTTITCS